MLLGTSKLAFRELLPYTPVPWERVRSLEARSSITPAIEVLETVGQNRLYTDRMDASHLATSGDINLCPRSSLSGNLVRVYGSPLVGVVSLGAPVITDHDHTSLSRLSTGFLFSGNGTYDMTFTVRYQNMIAMSDHHYFSEVGAQWTTNRRRVFVTAIHVKSTSRIFAPDPKVFHSAYSGYAGALTPGATVLFDVNTATSTTNLHPASDIWFDGTANAMQATSAGDLIPDVNLSDVICVRCSESGVFSLNVSLNTFSEKPGSSGYYHSLLVVPYVYAYNIAAYTNGLSSGYPTLPTLEAMALISSKDRVDLSAVVMYRGDVSGGNSVGGTAVFGVPSL